MTIQAFQIDCILTVRELELAHTALRSLASTMDFFRDQILEGEKEYSEVEMEIKDLCAKIEVSIALLMRGSTDGKAN